VQPLLERLYLSTTRGTATIGWLEGPWATKEDAYTAGKMLLRFWLALTAHGLVLHPFGSVITNPRAHARLGERLGDVDETVWLLLRIGYSTEPPESARLPVEDVLR
jgi:hypothetical protein